jgi:hypothetical protein
MEKLEHYSLKKKDSVLKKMHGRYFTGLQDAGLTGDGRQIILIQKKMQKFLR